MTRELIRERCLDFIDAYWVENWTSPSVREIAEHLHWRSPGQTHEYLQRLVAAGWLEVRRPAPRRAIYRTARSVRSLEERKAA